MIGISVIGTPNAFEILSGGIAKNLPIEPKVDLKNSLINVFPNSDIMMARRELDGKDCYFYFVYYRFATEMSTSRPGSYYGSAIVLKNRGVPQGDLVDALRDLADIVKDLCLDENDKFVRDIKGLKFSYPASVTRLQHKLNKAFWPPAANANQSGFLYLNGSKEISFYDEFVLHFLNSKVLSNFQTIYASTDQSVLDYVRAKKGLEVIDIPKLTERIRKEEEQRRREENNREQARIVAEREKERKLREAQTAQTPVPWNDTRIPASAFSSAELSQKIRNLENRMRTLEERVGYKGGFFASWRERIVNTGWKNLLTILIYFFIGIIALVLFYVGAKLVSSLLP